MAETQTRARRTTKKVEADVQTGDVLNVEGLDTTIEDKGSDTVCVPVSYTHLKEYGATKGRWIHVPGRYSSRITHVHMDGEVFDLNVGLYDSCLLYTS